MFNYAWHTDRSRPQPIIVECQYAWGERYKPYAKTIGGFTKTMQNKESIRAYRFSNVDGIVGMQIKVSPCSPRWYGDGSIPGGVGYVCLKGAPSGIPRSKTHKVQDKSNVFI